MRKLILEVQVSVDGFIAGIKGNTDWMVWNWGTGWQWDKELQKYHTDLTKSADCIVLSRQMAEEGFIAHWANAAENPNDPRFEFAKHITNTHKIVFSKTLDKSVVIPGGWNNTDIGKGDIAGAINRLKKKDGKDIIVYGGATLVSSLIKAGLIDEFQLIVNPVAIGRGMAIFKELGTNQEFNLVKATPFSCGIVVLHYQLKKK
jgi:dihydrofolate reductase